MGAAQGSRCLVKIIHEDAAIVVVDKPHGQHVQPTPQGAEGTLLTEAQAQYGPSIRLVHRLDRDASGLLVLARGRKTAGVLGDALRVHAIERIYRAVVSVPLPAGLQATISEPLRWAGGRTWVDPNGTPAVTHYEVVGPHEHGTELRVQLETGRMHQIRVHLAHAVGPIVGDRKYGGAAGDQLCLRATHLAFAHPISGERLEFSLDN